MEETRQKLILEILARWCQDTKVAEESDARSYTHASCGYHSAQSDVEEIMKMSVEQLRTYLQYYEDAEG